MIEVKTPIRHNGRRYREGDVITDITPEQAAMLVEAGAADWPRVKPNFAVRSAFVGESTDNSDEDTVDWDVEVRQYHRGFGRYDIPGVGIVQGRDKAIKSLQSQFGKM